jgi:hypothetical protein
VVLWFALPTLLMSMGTSKLYHYMYPFLPPLALAGGYVMSTVATLVVAQIDRGLQVLDRHTRAAMPFAINIRKPVVVRALLRGTMAVAALAAAFTLLVGPIRFTLGQSIVVSSAGIVRPLVVIALCAILSGDFRLPTRIVVALVVGSLLPLQPYRNTLPRLMVEQHVMRSASECLVQVEEQAGVRPGLYLDERYVSHPLYYYFRRVRPVTRTESPDFAVIERYLVEPSESRPVLLWDSAYQEFMAARVGAGPRRSPPMIAFPDLVLLLPGPYEQCSVPPSGSSSNAPPSRAHL